MAISKRVIGIQRGEEKNQTNVNNVTSVSELQVVDGKLQADDRDLNPGVKV